MTADPTFHCLARDLKGSEGPLTTRDNQIYMVAASLGQILRIEADGSHHVFATSPAPAGLQLHCDGDIWVADMKSGIRRISPDGVVHDEVTTFDGKPIRGCNDLAFDSRGNLYFTAPAGSNGKPGGAVGEVYFRSVNGEVRRLADGLAFPNGIAVGPNDDLLIVAETFTHKLLAFDLPEPGIAANFRTWAILPHEDEKAGGDGLDFAANGDLVATAYSRGSLEIYNCHGTHQRSISLPFKMVSNVHFFNDTSGRLLITEHTNHAIWIYDYGSTGQPQFGWTD